MDVEFPMIKIEELTDIKVSAKLIRKIDPILEEGEK